MYGVIYQILNTVNGKRYIGQSVEIDNRRSVHFGRLRKKAHRNVKLQNAFNKYGESSFRFEIIEQEVPKALLNQREMWWIDYYDSFHSGYNCTIGGDGNSGLNRRQCEWNGVIYDSVRLAATALHINENTMLKRLNNGWRSDTDIPKRPVADLGGGTWANLCTFKINISDQS